MSTAARHLVDDAVRSPAHGGSRIPAVELALGDPWRDGSIRFADVVADEGDERLRPELRRTLFDELDLGAALVATPWGGTRASARGLVRELRPLFRRDPATGILVGALPVLATAGAWIHPAGAEIARELLAGRQLAVALDGAEAVLSSSAAESSDGGLRLSGRLPLVALPDGARLVAVRAAGRVCLVETDAAGAVSRGAARTATGLRGVPFTSLDLHEAPVVASWPVDVEADAEAAAIVAALWASTVDTALRLAVSYARGRELYGGTVWDLPHARSLIADACTDLLIADAVAHAVLDGAAADALALVPTLLNDGMRSLSVLFGSSFYARVEPYAVFETLLRDIASMRMLSSWSSIGVPVGTSSEGLLVGVTADPPERVTASPGEGLTPGLGEGRTPVLGEAPSAGSGGEARAAGSAEVATLELGKGQTSEVGGQGLTFEPGGEGLTLEVGGGGLTPGSGEEPTSGSGGEAPAAGSAEVATLELGEGPTSELGEKGLTVESGSERLTLEVGVEGLTPGSGGAPTPGSGEEPTVEAVVGLTPSLAEAPLAGPGVESSSQDSPLVWPGSHETHARESARVAGEFVPRVDAIVDAAARSGDSGLAARLVAVGVAGVRHPSEVPLWQAMAIVADTRERGATSTWRRAALTRLEMRLTGRRGMLGDELIEALASHVARRADEGVSVTFDTVGVFAAREDEAEEEERS